MLTLLIRLCSGLCVASLLTGCDSFPTKIHNGTGEAILVDFTTSDSECDNSEPFPLEVGAIISIRCKPSQLRQLAYSTETGARCLLNEEEIQRRVRPDPGYAGSYVLGLPNCNDPSGHPSRAEDQQ